MKSLSLSSILIVSLACLVLLSGCLDDLHYHVACQVPKAIEHADVIGTWRAEYDNFRNPYGGFVPGSEMISGIEEITLQLDGTYTQSFRSPEYTYERSGNRWELLDHPSEGVKLVMHDLVYFAHGLTLARGPLELFPQSADLNRYQERLTATGIQAEKLEVDYPDDGFVYLYPRNCLGKLSLLQMTSSRGDPDMVAPLNPIFSKVK
ncbi:MAG: hypothetical protein WA040_04320 [Anaerolineae bacterium]|jgi:hypothetical protein